MKPQHKAAWGCGSLFVALLGLILGIEETPREHGTEYELFVKQMPTLQVIYRNPAVCGECDVEPFASLTPPVKSEFAEFCRVRYGISEVRACYGIYLERQRIANEGRTEVPSRSEAHPSSTSRVDAVGGLN
ncbi:hypothetical protein [Inhella proteolytica]|uniref:Uncharacterized protein n=1 Tax=Inhella proteolytica TaxID=2795029 RepID=A0A931J3E8_9BURK|nr:hypothetical protein [Inhella proteolytica]MBH9578859.1 hypothetical protein [Inhella proteolytica]